jgi:hypothetical protein
METTYKKNTAEVADIVNQYGPEYLEKHRLCPEQQKAYQAIINCRTSFMGGHLQECDQCGHQRPAYNSCRNRHCPKCQYIKQVQWVDKLKAQLPATRYFHLVFTIPSELHKLFYINQKVCYDLLFKAASTTLKQVAANPEFLGAETGAVAVLHTWGQTLTYHPHIHMIVPAGGLSSDQTEWVHAGKKFFLPVKALSKIFRGILCRRIGETISDEAIRLPEGISNFDELKKKLYEKNWNVFSKKAFGGAGSVVEYLGNYTHRVAISNNRIMNLDKGLVTFRWKDYRKALKGQYMELKATEFISRFFHHILPSGFYKIRYYGLLASANSKTKKELIFQLIGKSTYLSTLEGLNGLEVVKMVTGKDLSYCPVCKRGRMRNSGLALLKASPS